MAQVNNLLVTGQASVSSDLIVSGKISEEGIPIEDKYLSQTEATQTYITASYNSSTKTLTIHIP